jgi:uncharacterized membrane protein
LHAIYKLENLFQGGKTMSQPYTGTQLQNNKELKKKSTAKFISSLNATNDDRKHYSVIIKKSPQEVFTFWRDFSNLKHFMKDISDIRVLDPKTSRWSAEVKPGQHVHWDVEVAEEQPGKMISWRSTPESEVHTVGCVYFDRVPGKRGTIVRLSMIYNKPAGVITEFIHKFSGQDPEMLVLLNLRRLKAFLESGEMPTIQGQPSGCEETKIKH